MSYADGLKVPKHNSLTSRMGYSAGGGPVIKGFVSSTPVTSQKPTKRRRASAG